MSIRIRSDACCVGSPGSFAFGARAGIAQPPR